MEKFFTILLVLPTGSAAYERVIKWVMENETGDGTRDTEDTLEPSNSTF